MYLVFCNVPPNMSRATARRLVTEGWAACVNIIPGVTSMYVWDNEFIEDSEDTLLIKIARERWEAFRDFLTEIHPYSNPEIIAVDPAGVPEAYKAWVRETAG